MKHVAGNNRALQQSHLYGVIKHRLQCYVSQFASSPVAMIREEALDAIIGLFLACENGARTQEALGFVLSEIGHRAIKEVSDTFMSHALDSKQNDLVSTSAYEVQRVAEVVSSMSLVMPINIIRRKRTDSF